MNNLLTPNARNTEILTPRHFHDLADLQRDRPELAMLRVQFANLGGVLNPVVEHVGDIIHRMSERPTFHSAGYEFVKPKVQKTLEWLTHGWEHDFGDPTDQFRREMNQNFENNARYMREKKRDPRLGDPILLKAHVRSKLKTYADEHAKLPEYNEAHHHAKQAAISLGHMDFNKTVKHLRALNKHLGSREEWVAYAHQGLGKPIQSIGAPFGPTSNAKPTPKDIARELSEGELHSIAPYRGGWASSTFHITTAKNKLQGLYKSAITRAADVFPIPPDTGHLREIAAYHIAHHLGISHMVPIAHHRLEHSGLIDALKVGHTFPNSGTTFRHFKNRTYSHFFQGQKEVGSVHHFIDYALQPHDALPFFHGSNKDDLRKAAAFDYLIGNMDRHHQGNWLVRKHPQSDKRQLKLVDHQFILPSWYTGTFNEYGDSVFPRELEKAVALHRIPDMTHWSNWHNLEHVVRSVQAPHPRDPTKTIHLDEPAIERMRVRHRHLTSGHHTFFKDLPSFGQLAYYHGDPSS